MRKVIELAINECGIVGREKEVNRLRSLIAETTAGKKAWEEPYRYYNGPGICLVYGSSGVSHLLSLILEVV